MEELRRALKDAGFESLGEFEAAKDEADKAGAQAEARAAEIAPFAAYAADRLQYAAGSAGPSVRFVDLTGLSFEAARSLWVAAIALRETDQVGDTVYYWPGSDVPVVTYPQTEAGEAMRIRAEKLGVKALPIGLTATKAAALVQTSTMYKVGHGYLWAGVTDIRFISKRFATLEDGHEAIDAIATQTLDRLGVGVEAIKGNNLLLDGRKICSTNYIIRNGVTSLTIELTRVFDFELGARVFNQDIRAKIYTLGDLLSRDIKPDEIKEAALAALGVVLGAVPDPAALNEAEARASS
jgi:hypothetical protein